MRKLWILLTILIVVVSGCENRPDITSEPLKEGVLVVESEQDESKSNDIDKATDDEIQVDEASNSDDKVDVNEVIDTVDITESQRLLEAMSLEEKVAQMFYLSLSTYKSLDRPPVGGIIYFKEDMVSILQVSEEIRELQETTSIPMFVGVDEEGGIVTRITGSDSIGGTVVPSPWHLAHLDKFMSVYQGNLVIARELNALGFNMNFAPVADVITNPNNTVIGKRAFSDDATYVSKMVKEAIMAYDGQDIIPVLKHFPGHGDTIGDSHLENVSIPFDLDRLSTTELLPFVAGIESGCDVVMMGHIQVPNVIESDIPASLSKRMIGDVLRIQLGFEGLVISDALNMKAISNDYNPELLAEMAIDAGLDMLLMPEDYIRTYDRLLEMAHADLKVVEMIDRSVLRILELKLSSGLLNKDRKIHNIEIIGSEEHYNSISRLYEKND